MKNHFFAFLNEEDGAVTVDWVVLTAAIILVTISAYVSIQSASNTMSASVGTFLSDTELEQLRNPTP